MKIMQILPELNSGGVEKGTLEIAEALTSAGHESIVVSNGGRLVTALQSTGTQHITLPVHKKSIFSLLQVAKLRRVILANKPDIVHVRSRVPAWITFFALKGIPIEQRPHWVSTVHGFYSVNRYSAIMAAAQTVIAVSDSVVEYIKTAYPNTPTSKITRIFRGIDPREFPHGYQPAAAWWINTYKNYSALEDKQILMLPGRITRLKGHDTLINLMQGLSNDFPNVLAVIVGDADEKKQAYLEELKTKIANVNLTEKIIFVGHQTDMRNWLSASNIVLSLSNQAETFGRTVLEAVALGKPTVGWARGGVQEILSALYPTGLVTPDDDAALEQKIRQLLIAPEMPQPVNQFLKSQMTENTLALYQTIVDNKIIDNK